MMWEQFADCCQRSVKVALMVGTLLSLGNQRDLIFETDFEHELNNMSGRHFKPAN